MGIIAQIMLHSGPPEGGAPTVPPSVLVFPPTLTSIGDERVLSLLEEDRLLTLIADKRKVVKADA